MNFTQIIIFPIAVYSMGSDLSIIYLFTAADYFCLIGVGGLTIINQVMRFRALKNSEASRLQPYAFTRPLQQYLTDILVFSTVFNWI